MKPNAAGEAPTLISTGKLVAREDEKIGSAIPMPTFARGPPTVGSFVPVDIPQISMLWIKELEMVDSMEELKSSRSVAGKNFPNFEMLDAKTASALNKIIQNSQYFRVTGAHDTVLYNAYLFSVTLHDDNIQEFDTRWDTILSSVTKIPSGNILDSLYKWRIRETDQVKAVLELYDMEIHQKISMPNYKRLRTMVKRRKDQQLRLRNF